MLARWPEYAEPAALRLVTAPAQEPVTLAEAKERLRITGDSFDADLHSLLRAARQEIDGSSGWLGRALITQTWDLVLDALSLGRLAYLHPAAAAAERHQRLLCRLRRRVRRSLPAANIAS